MWKWFAFEHSISSFLTQFQYPTHPTQMYTQHTHTHTHRDRDTTHTQRDRDTTHTETQHTQTHTPYATLTRAFALIRFLAFRLSEWLATFFSACPILSMEAHTNVSLEYPLMGANYESGKFACLFPPSSITFPCFFCERYVLGNV